MSRCNGAREICAKTGSLPIREITTRLKHYCDFMAIDAVTKSDDDRLMPVAICAVPPNERLVPSCHPSAY